MGLPPDATPELSWDNFGEEADGTRTWAIITVPQDFQPCDRCVLRLVRQALEWGDDYKFHSCADVVRLLAVQLVDILIRVCY